MSARSDMNEVFKDVDFTAPNIDKKLAGGFVGILIGLLLADVRAAVVMGAVVTVIAIWINE